MAGLPPLLTDDTNAPLAPWLADSDEPWDEVVLRRCVARWLVGMASFDDWHCYARDCTIRAAHRPLHWIIRQPGCDRATAQLIFSGSDH